MHTKTLQIGTRIHHLADSNAGQRIEVVDPKSGKNKKINTAMPLSDD